MSEQVKRFDFFAYLNDGFAELGYHECDEGSYVRYEDHERIVAALSAQTAPQGLRIVLDGPPGPEAGRFVEVENAAGRSVNAGEWRERADGLWELVLHASQGGE